MTDSVQLDHLLQQLASTLTELNLSLATAESCTGGGIGQALTSVSGSSAWYLGGVIAYSNGVKTSLLRVPSALIEQYGAVSEQVAAAMVSGTSSLIGSDLSVSTTGIAGPDGGSAEKPVGTVCFGWYVKGAVHTETVCFPGSRSEVREQSVCFSIKRLIEQL